MSAPEDDAQTPTPATILERLTMAGITEDRALAWIAQGSVRVGGEVRVGGDPVNDPTTAVPWPTAYTLNSA